MEAKYIIDMQNNYLILEDMDNSTTTYMAKMILNNHISGILDVELRSVDNKDFFYYDISLKDSMYNIYEKRFINYEELKKLLSDIVGAIENSREYLLKEENFVLKPDYIYINQKNDQPELCYYIGYNLPLTDQFAGLLEYFMNKVDYKDEKVVLLIYSLYKIVRDGNITLDQVKLELSKDIKEFMPKSLIEEDNFIANKESDISLDKLGPEDLDLDIEDNKEIVNHSKRTYLIGAVAALLGLVVFLLAFKLKLLHNSFGTRLDVMKVLCFLVIIVSMEWLIISKAFKKDQIFPQSYRDNLAYKARAPLRGTAETRTAETEIAETETAECLRRESQMLWRDTEDDEYDNETVILADLTMKEKSFYLEAVDYDGGRNCFGKEMIKIDVLPFIVGKNQIGVNYTINDDSVSRFHAKIEQRHDAISVTDLGSTNGTYVNDIKIEEQVPFDLSNNDILRFSKCGYVVRM